MRENQHTVPVALQEREHTVPLRACPNGHQSTMQTSDGKNVCMDCGATW